METIYTLSKPRPIPNKLAKCVVIDGNSVTTIIIIQTNVHNANTLLLNDSFLYLYIPSTIPIILINNNMI